MGVGVDDPVAAVATSSASGSYPKAFLY